MTRVERLRFDDQTIRLALIANRWWVFCEDAAPQIDSRLMPEELFVNAPEWEREFMSVGKDSCAYLVSARYLLYWLHRSEATNHNRLRAWLYAWKIISEAGSFREAIVGHS